MHVSEIYNHLTISRLQSRSKYLSQMALSGESLAPVKPIMDKAVSRLKIRKVVISTIFVIIFIDTFLITFLLQPVICMC